VERRPLPIAHNVDVGLVFNQKARCKRVASLNGVVKEQHPFAVPSAIHIGGVDEQRVGDALVMVQQRQVEWRVASIVLFVDFRRELHVKVKQESHHNVVSAKLDGAVQREASLCLDKLVKQLLVQRVEMGGVDLLPALLDGVGCKGLQFGGVQLVGNLQKVDAVVHVHG
jgi:hypothetical protein